jgi:glycosyltransferase involved in cell wall biosynthesis
MNRRKILMSAYACGPGRGSEPGIGWNTAREMAVHHDVWLVTSRENRDDIESELATHPVRGLQVVFVDWPQWLASVKSSRPGYELQHYLWQVVAYFCARRLHRRIHFDVVHHVTMGRYWMPSFMAMLPVPFVWGPVGGGESVPRRFWRGLGLKGAMVELVRESARWIGEHDPFLALTARRSAVALATTEESRQRMARLGARSLCVLPQVGLSRPELEFLSAFASPESPPVRFISIGRLLCWKGFHLGLRAFAALNCPQTEYWIVGSGPAGPSLAALARQLGVESRVRFFGGLTRQETLVRLKDAHVLVHPSLHESGGMVCVEAMAAGKPVICLNLGGPALQVTDETGFKIEAQDPHHAVPALTQAMQRLAASPDLRLRMGASGRARAREFDWRRRTEDLSQYYLGISPYHV